MSTLFLIALIIILLLILAFPKVQERGLKMFQDFLYEKVFKNAKRPEPKKHVDHHSAHH